MIDATHGGLYLVIPADVAEDVHLRERSKLIYGRIVQLASATGYCYASNQALLEILTYADPETGAVRSITERTLQSVLAELRDRGHIHMDEGPIPISGGEGSVVRRRIFVGRKLADMPPEEGGEKNFIPEENFTPGVKKISPPYKIGKNNASKNNPPISPQVDTQVLFDRFWSAYPRKEGKRDARKAWDKLAPDLELCRVMASALEAQKRSAQWTKDGGEYIPYPAKWLRGRRWEDEVTPQPPGPGGEPAVPWEERFGWK